MSWRRLCRCWLHQGLPWWQPLVRQPFPSIIECMCDLPMYWMYIYHTSCCSLLGQKSLNKDDQTVFVWLISINKEAPESASGLLPDTQNCGLCMRRECRERFPRHRGLAIPTCITARVWRNQVVTFEVSGRENVPGIPGACATRNFTYLARGLCAWR